MRVSLREAEAWAQLVADHFDIVGRNPTQTETDTMVVLARAVVSASEGRNKGGGHGSPKKRD